MSKFLLKEEILQRFLQQKDLVVFKTTKQQFLKSLPFEFDQYNYFHNMMDSLESMTKDMSTTEYVHVKVNNIKQDYCMNHPLWSLTKIHYFYTHKISEFYSPITFSYIKPKILKFHPGSWRMAMLPYQENTLQMTMCIDTENTNAKILLDCFSNHDLQWVKTMSYKNFCKFMNFHKFPGQIFVQNTISGVNFSTDRSKNLEYIGKFDLAYSKNQRTFYLNHKPLVRWKSGFWHIL